MFSLYVPVFIHAVAWALIVALVSIGLNLIFSITGFFNVAHGSFFMLSIFLTFTLLNRGMNFILVFVTVPIFLAAIFMGLEKSIFRRVEGDTGASVLLTVGLMICLQQIALASWGGGYITLSPVLKGTIKLFGISISQYDLFVSAFVAFLLLTFRLFLTKTDYGRKIRAISNNRIEAASVGINIDIYLVIIFGMLMIMNAWGGILASPFVGGHYLMGLEMLILAIVVTNVGGVGSLRGTIVAAFSLAFIENIFLIWFEPIISRVAALTILVGVLMLKPEGIYPGEI